MHSDLPRISEARQRFAETMRQARIAAALESIAASLATIAENSGAVAAHRSCTTVDAGAERRERRT